MTPLPEAPWRELNTEFYGPLPNGEYLLVSINEHSRHPIFETVKSISASTVIPVANKVNYMFGVPDVLKSDNGSPFNREQLNSTQRTWNLNSVACLAQCVTVTCKNQHSDSQTFFLAGTACQWELGWLN